MESLSRPPHRRKQSSSNTGAFASFSMKNPYDDVLFSGGGTKARPFGVHEYSEIFAGSSSSIPVLDLPGLDESVVSGECRSSKLDYSNIFGGLRDDDVALPYEELFNGVKKPKRSDEEPGILANARLPVQESESLHSSGKAKRSSGESADQSVDGVKQQFNLSFNKTNQKSNDVSKGTAHIAQLHAVPGFTYFIDGIQQMQRKEDDRRVPLLKREVSRTWSFSSNVEAIKGRGGSSSDNSHTLDKSHIVPPPSSQPCNQREHNDSEGSRTSSFQSKDASGKIGSDSLPPLFEDEIDESSVAGVSAAALKKAIEQAQESIRIAKMIMERKKDIPDGSEPGPKGRSKVKDSEQSKDMKNLKEKMNAGKTYERLDPIFHAFKELNGKIDAFLGQSEKMNDPEEAEMEKVRVNIEAAKEHGGAFNGARNKFATSSSQNEALCDVENVVVEELGNNVKSVEAHEGARNTFGLEAETERRTTDTEHGQVVDNNEMIMSRHALTSYAEEMGTGEETLKQKEVSVHYTEGPEKATKLAKSGISTSQMTRKLDNIDEASEQVELAVDLTKESEIISEMVERSPNISPSTLVQVVQENVDDVGADSRVSQEDEVIDEGQTETDDLGKHEKIIEEHEEVVNAAHLKLPDLKFDNLMNDLPNMDEKDAMEQEEMVKKCIDVLNCRGSSHRHGKSWDEEKNGMRLSEALKSFESKEHLNDEALEEPINKRDLEAFPEIEEVVEKLNTVHEPETPNNLHGEGGIRVQGVLEQNKIDESEMQTFEDEVAEAKQLEGINYAEFQKIDSSWGTNKTNILRGTQTSAENQDKTVYQEAACGIDIEAVDAKSNETSTSFSQIQNNNPYILFSETQEPCDINLDNVVEENSSVAGVAETGKKVKQPFHLEDDDILRTDSLHRSASEDNFTSSNLHYAFEGLSFGCQTENFGTTKTNNEENLPVDKDTSETTDEIHNTAQEAVDKFNLQNSPEVNYSDYRTAECDLTDVGMVSEQTSESVGRSESTSSLENMDDLSIKDSEICADNTKNVTSDEEEFKDDLKIASEKITHVRSEEEYSEEQCEGELFHLHVEPEETEKSTEDERSIETGESLEKINENSETSTMEQNCAKENVTNFDKEDQRQRIEAIKKGRAREKDRIAAERAMREARERAFAEAQVRAERAAVERAAAEARQRFMAEAQEKLEKASTAAKLPFDKVSTEAKLRSERAAVERATAEARERALEKAMSLKTSTEGRTHTDKSTEKSRNNGLKHSFSSSDLEKFDGTSNESAKRSKARLERHQRIMERAAKALAEKNMRDLLAQKEQAERNRLAESLDADIKRWVTGKEGNLRALLSTLQYILGPNSGWQPISLTEIITTPAVKKAYRKATLYVHPDKLQQRGASIQQKYICEKVFDLLKAAWNRFNSEER